MLRFENKTTVYIPKDLIENKRLSKNEFAFVAHYAAFGKNDFERTFDQIADDCRFSRKSGCRAVAALERKGLLTHRHALVTGRNIYNLSLQSDEAFLALPLDPVYELDPKKLYAYARTLSYAPCGRNIIFPSKRRAAKDAGVSRNTLRSSIEALKYYGWIGETQRGYRDTNAHGSSEYVVIKTSRGAQIARARARLQALKALLAAMAEKRALKKQERKFRPVNIVRRLLSGFSAAVFRPPRRVGQF